MSKLELNLKNQTAVQSIQYTVPQPQCITENGSIISLYVWDNVNIKSLYPNVKSDGLTFFKTQI